MLNTSLKSEKTMAAAASIELFSAPTPNGQKVQIALEELGLPYELRLVNLQERQHLTPQFRSLNPNQEIPVLKVGDETFWETGAILFTLATRYGRLLPEDPKRRSRALMWTYAQTGGLGPAMSALGAQMRLPPTQQSAELRAHFYGQVSKRLGSLNEELTDGRPYLAGEYSIADIMFYPFLVPLWQARAPVLTCRPLVEEWLRRVGAREAVQRVLPLA